eukprot:scaffold223691_cov34-Tisochrysis_lutea.AAC.4
MCGLGTSKRPRICDMAVVGFTVVFIVVGVTHRFELELGKLRFAMNTVYPCDGRHRQAVFHCAHPFIAPTTSIPSAAAVVNRARTPSCPVGVSNSVHVRRVHILLSSITRQIGEAR